MRALKEYVIYDKVQISAQTNGLFYFLRKLPLIGKKIPEAVYGGTDFKQVVFIFVFVFRLFMGMGMKFLYLFAAFGLQLYLGLLTGLFDESNPLMFSMEQSLLLWVLLLNAVNFLGAWFLSMDVAVWKFVEGFQIPRVRFVRSRHLLDTFKQALFYVPAALLAGGMASSFRVALGIPLAYLALRFFWSWFSRATWQLFPKARLYLGLMVTIILLASAGLGFWFFGEWGHFLFTWPSIVGWGLLAAFFALQLSKFQNEDAYVHHLWEKTTQALDKAQVNVAERELKLSMVKKMELATSERVDNLSGNAYLDALLFLRYKTMLRKALWLRLGLIIVPGLILIGFAFFFGDDSTSWTDFDPEAQDSIVAILMFVMYFVSFGKNIVQIAFANCDFAMLRYPFYRESRSIVASFRFRFLKTLGYNAILGSALFGVILLASIGYFRDFYGTFLLTKAVVITILALLFSFHDLFLYYLIQPFSEDMQVKSPLYQFIRGAFYMVIFQSLSIQEGLNALLGDRFQVNVILALLTVSALYVLIGFPVIYKWAPKTFKLR